MASKVPETIDALVAQLRTPLPVEVSLYDGFGISDDPGDYVMVGVEAPDVPGAAFSASSDQKAGPMGSDRSRDENGSVWLAAYSWNGDIDQKAARDAVYGYMAVVETLLKATPNLGITTGPLYVAQMGDTQRLAQNQTPSGAEALLIFNVQFFARI